MTVVPPLLWPFCRSLTGTPITDDASAVAAMTTLHASGVRQVVVTSSNLPAGQSEVMTLYGSVPWGTAPDNCNARATIHPPGCAMFAANAVATALTVVTFCFLCWAADVDGEVERWPEAARSGSHARFRIVIPRMPFHFTGTGDLTAALLLAWSHRLPGRFALACEHVIASVQVGCPTWLRIYRRHPVRCCCCVCDGMCACDGVCACARRHAGSVSDYVPKGRRHSPESRTPSR